MVKSPAPKPRRRGFESHKQRAAIFLACFRLSEKLYKNDNKNVNFAIEYLLKVAFGQRFEIELKFHILGISPLVGHDHYDCAYLVNIDF